MRARVIRSAYGHRMTRKDLSRYRTKDIVPEELPDEEQWQRLERETNQAYEAFTIYRELGTERSQLKAEQIYRERKGQCVPTERISSQFVIYAKRFSWRKRADAYDRWQGEQDLAVLRAKRSETLRKEAQEAREIVDVLMYPIRGLKERIEQIVAKKRDDQLDDLTDAEYLALGKASAQAIAQMHRNEREILGVDAESNGQASSVDIQMRAEAVRAAIGNPDTIAAMEKFTMDVAVRMREAQQPKTLAPGSEQTDVPDSPEQTDDEEKSA